MAADASADPRGIYMSLDDIIEENNKEKRSKSQNKLNQGEGFQGARGRGRGGRSRGRGRNFGRGGRGNQQHYADNGGQGQTVRVVVQNQAPSFEYRRFQDCYQDEYGNVIFTYKDAELVRVSRAGDVTINGQGHTLNAGSELRSMNDALNCLDIYVRPSQPTNPASSWNVVDGKALLRYRNGLILPAKGPQHAVRGQALMTAVKQPDLSLAAAATAASNAAAAQAGLFSAAPFGYGPQAAAMPYMQQQYQMGIPNLAGNMPMHNGDFGFDTGMGYGKDQTQMRRDRARGRLPY